jgi:hypothetical protein
MHIQGLRDWADVIKAFYGDDLIRFGDATTLCNMHRRCVNNLASADHTTKILDGHPDTQREWQDDIAEDYQFTCTLKHRLESALDAMELEYA